MGMFFRSHMVSPYIKELYSNSDEDFVNNAKGLIKMNIESIKRQLVELFKINHIKYNGFIDCKNKQIYTVINSSTVNIIEPIQLNIFLQENTAVYELVVNKQLIIKIEDTYDSELGIAFTQWFKSILRNLVNEKYELEGDVISDELMGTDYCQVRKNGILLFINFSEMVEFTI